MTPEPAKGAPAPKDNRWRLVEATMRRHGHQSHALIEALHTAQEAYGFLEDDVLRMVATRAARPAQQGLRRRDLLQLLHAQAAGPPHLRRLHRHGLLHQGRPARS